jgi:excisionase family DNA binding protein
MSTIEFELLSPTQVAKEIGCTRQRITQLIGEKRITATRIGERIFVITRSEVERLKEERRREARTA